MKTSKQPKAQLISGSLYQKENIEFISQTRAFAEDLFKYIAQEPDPKKGAIKKRAENILNNLLSLEVEIRWRKEKAIEDEKRRLASGEDGWIFGDNWLETHAIESISMGDYRQASNKYQERRERIAEEDATHNAEISARGMISKGLLNNEKILKNLATCGDERLIHAITGILANDGPAGCHEKWTAACEGRMISSN